MMVQATEVSATGDAMDTGAANLVVGLVGARLVSGSGAASTAIIRETDGAGRVLVRLQAAAAGVDDFTPEHPVAYKGKVHVTLTGAGATVLLYQ